MKHTADVIIIGAGIVGLCTALQLAKRSPLDITILEQAASLGGGSSGASSAVCRHLYTHNEMVELARDGIAAYRNWAGFLETCDNPVGKFHHTGVLWLASESTTWGSEHQSRLSNLGVASELLADSDVADRFPPINPCGLSPDFETGQAHACRGGGSHLLETDAGYMDPQYALDDLAQALSARGRHISFGQTVTGVLAENGTVKGVTCKNGDEYHAAYVINASGPWCNDMFREAGLPPQWPLRPTRIQILYLDPAEVDVTRLPVCGDLAGGIYFRPQGRQLIVGSVREEDEREWVDDPNEFNRLADDDFMAKIRHALHHRLPALTHRGKAGGYCGLYTINQTDMHPVVGRTPIEGFIVANGFSGHGFKLAPAIGSMIAREVTGERILTDTTVPSEFLSWDRQPINLSSKNVLA